MVYVKTATQKKINTIQQGLLEGKSQSEMSEVVGITKAAVNHFIRKYKLVLPMDIYKEVPIEQRKEILNRIKETRRITVEDKFVSKFK